MRAHVHADEEVRCSVAGVSYRPKICNHIVVMVALCQVLSLVSRWERFQESDRWTV